MIDPPRKSSSTRRKQSSTRGEDVVGDGPSALPRARRRFGQNFLTDPSAIRRVAAALSASASENVLEIGPGRGALTDVLLGVSPRITAIEIDRDLCGLLRAHYPEDRLRLIEKDVLDVDFLDLAQQRPLVIAGNLPYNISKPVAMKLVHERRAVSRAVLMFQREVALRLTATPGTGAYGPLTVLAGRAYRIERLFDLAPGAFQPSPKVVSTVTRWTPRPADDLPESLVAPLRSVLRAAFSRRRQTLQKNLRVALRGGEAEARSLLAEARLDGALRAEAIPPEGFVALAGLWSDRPSG
jgi:16S rRNA (adenine1518-N6/adenine1519-N6)-dimethyltransferase